MEEGGSAFCWWCGGAPENCFAMLCLFFVFWFPFWFWGMELEFGTGVWGYCLYEYDEMQGAGGWRERDAGCGKGE